MKKAIVFGAGGFIGSHWVEYLKAKGFWVLAVDLKHPAYFTSSADEFVLADLRDKTAMKSLWIKEATLYQFAADMGGAGYVFTGDNDAEVMTNSAQINTNTLRLSIELGIESLFFASSACIYPRHLQRRGQDPYLKEDDAYPAHPDSDYGWEKLFAERMYRAVQRNYGIPCRIARFHNVYGPYGVYEGGKEKAVAALCRKVALATEGDSVEVWGDGRQQRSFLFIEDCMEGIWHLMKASNADRPLNIGSSEMVSINDLAKLIIKQSNKALALHHIDGPVGVDARSSDNTLAEETIQWRPKVSLKEGVKATYSWISGVIQAKA